MSRDDPAGTGRCRTTCKGVRRLVAEQSPSGLLQGDWALGDEGEEAWRQVERNVQKPGSRTVERDSCGWNIHFRVRCEGRKPLGSSPGSHTGF